ncbi:protein binding protein, putative [Ricinus communis]|uniref:Protein binding protein, putative n=2 Tax=Ricinus communis TaxID=3988 RepID=B9RNL1_RICCO|nr:protein binding protein, putative [Ricinus communis]
MSLLAHIKLAILGALSYIHHHSARLYKGYCRANHANHVQDSVDQEAEESRPSPSLVPVPYMSHVMSKLIKHKLPVIAFSETDPRTAVHETCAICLSCIDKRQEIRLPGNCSHLFHRECMDEWVDHGHGTCPLCRLKLLPAQNGKDPWREERIAYLFGEDWELDGF